MSEFVGRTGSRRVYSYPEARRNTTVPFARNSALGPTTDTAIAFGDGVTGGTVIPWSVLGVGAAGTNVPITPRTTGLITISGVFVVLNNSGAPVDVQAQVAAPGRLPIPATEKVTVPANGYAAIPFLAGGVGVVGTTSNVSIVLTAFTDDVDVELIAGSSSLEIQEVSLPTG